MRQCMKKILVIDDDREIFEVISLFVGEDIPDCCVLSAESGEEGLHVAATEKPDVIVLDINLPGMDGFKTCMALRSESTTKNIPVILLSGVVTDAPNRAKGLDTGAVAFLTKPFDNEELLSVIKARLRIQNESRFLLHNELGKLKRALHESEETAKALLNTSTNSLMVADPDGKILYANPVALKLFGGRKKKLTGHSVFDILPEEMALHMRSMFREVLASGKIKTFKNYAAQKHLKNHIYPILNNNGEIYRIVVHSSDKTEEKTVEDLLKASEEKYRAVVEKSGEGIIIIQDEIIIFFNPKVVEVTGFSKQELMHKPLAALIHPLDRNMVMQRYRKRIKGENVPEKYTLRIVNKEDDEIWVEIHASIVSWDGRSSDMLFLNDITPRVTMERKLRKSEEKHRTILDSIEEAYYEVDLMGTLMFFNDSLCRISGYTKEELTGMKYKEYLENENVEVVFDIFNRVYKTRKPDRMASWKFLGRNHKRIHVESSISPIISNGEVVGFRGVLRDITERKETEEDLRRAHSLLEKTNFDLLDAYSELKSAQSKMLQSEKMASIGQLAAGVAHEINNPIGFITSNLGSLKKYMERFLEYMNLMEDVVAGRNDDKEGIKQKRNELKIDMLKDDVKDLISESLDGAGRVKKIVQDLKSFSRVDHVELQDADINECLETTLNIVWNELKYKAEVKREYGDIPLTRCYPQQLNQVFMNLLINASHAIEEHGYIKIRSWQDDGYIKVAISDTGCGIPQENITKLFEPFFTTKETGKGTGLGLSISYDIVKKHNGEILVESEPGRGSTFTVCIPVTGVN